MEGVCLEGKGSLNEEMGGGDWPLGTRAGEEYRKAEKERKTERQVEKKREKKEHTDREKERGLGDEQGLFVII